MSAPAGPAADPRPTALVGPDEAAADPDATLPADLWVELRVHGVSGTPPESILSSAFVTQVAGDDRGRFFRPADSLGHEAQPERGRILEAYHWGRFTSGSWTQALWLLIIPFGVVNAASFTLSRPTNRLGRRSAATAGAALRIIGLTMTCLLVFGSVEAAMDLFAWQLRGAGQGHRQWWSVGALVVPVALVVLFFYFGKTNKSGQEPGRDVHNDPGLRTPDPAATTGQRRTDELTSELTNPDFFAGDPDAPALRMLHCAAPLHMLSALVLWPSAAAGGTAAAWGWWIAFGLFAINAATVLCLGDPNKPGDYARWHRFAMVASRVLFYLGGGLLAVAALVAGSYSEPTTVASIDVPYRGMPGIGETAMILLVAMVSALLLLLVSSAVLAMNTSALEDPNTAALPAEQRYLRQRAFGRFAHGMTAWLLGSVGAFLSVGFAAAFTFAAQGSLNLLGTGREVRVTQILQRVAYAWGLTVIEIVVLGVLGGCLLLGRRRLFETAAAQTFTLDAIPPAGLPAEWNGKVGRAMFLARLKMLVPAVLTAFAVTGMVLSLVAGLEQQFRFDDRADIRDWGALRNGFQWLLGWTSGLSDDRLGWLVWLGTWTLTALSAALVILGRGAIRAEKGRRGLNVVWDVVAFWPRRAHPFVPPPYSQHVVAALRRRISWHLGTLQDPTAAPPPQAAGRLVVAAHSQGSLITVAALLWLTRDEEQRVGLVTFGSQLQQQFVKAFPAAIDLPLLESTWHRFGRRWRNLYRDTDPIAGPVLSWHHQAVRAPANHSAEFFGKYDTEPPGGDRIEPVTGRREYGPEWRLLDPIRQDAGLMAGPMYRIRGHGDYPDDPSWPDAVRAVLPDINSAATH